MQEKKNDKKKQPENTKEILKVLKLSNEEIIAKAISDLLKRDKLN